MKVKKKVVAAGHACLDITPVFPRSGGCRRIGDVLVPGRLIQMEGVSISSGGAVSNTGLAMRLLGAEVCLMAKTGMDEFGKILADIYRKYGAADGIIAVQGERTSYSAVIAVPGADRIFCTILGVTIPLPLQISIGRSWRMRCCFISVIRQS